MSDMKTKATAESAQDFIEGIDDPERRSDCAQVLELMKEITGEEAVMWGRGMVGFGTYHYKYDSGREGDWFLTGFASRKSALTLYATAGFDRYQDLMARLGKYKTGKSCLYVKKLDDIDMAVLRELIAESVQYMRRAHSA